jgi:hypothetical protein
VKMGQIRCPETSVNNYHTTLRNIPEQRRSYNKQIRCVISRGCLSALAKLAEIKTKHKDVDD